MRRNATTVPVSSRLLRRALAMATAAFLLSAPLHTPPAAEAASCPNAQLQPNQITISQFNGATLCLLNQERASRGLAPLTENPQLDSAALVHSTEMRQFGYFAHDSHNGEPFQNRIIDSGYLARASTWSVGENIAWGSWSLGTPEAITVAWMNSEHHRDNILDPDYHEIGVGSQRGSPSNAGDPAAIIVSHDFGRVTRQPRRSKRAKARARHRKAKRLKHMKRHKSL